MSSRYLFLYPLLLFPFLLKAQSPVIDSLKNEFFTQTNDSIRWELCHELYKEFKKIQIDSAFNWIQRGHRIAEQIDAPMITARSWYRLGVATGLKNEYTQALDYLIKAVELFRQLQDQKWVTEAEFEIGLTYRNMGKYEVAKPYFRPFYEYYQEQKDGPSILYALSNYTILFELLLQQDSVLAYAQKSLQVVQAYGLDQYLGKSHNNLAGAYYYKKDYRKARYHYQQAKTAGFSGDILGEYFNRYGLANVHFDLEQWDSSIHYALQAMDIIKPYGDLKKIADLQQLIGYSYAEKKDYKQALEYQQLYKANSDSLHALSRQEAFQELELQYETQKKENRIIQQDLELQRQSAQTTKIVLGAIAFISILTGFFLFFHYRQKGRRMQAEMQLRYQQKEAQRLKELDQLKSNFFANISHEFRTPLSLILGPLQQMLAGSFSGDRHKYLKIMVRNAERLFQLVNQILELSQLEAGRLQPDRKPGELVGFLRPVVYAYESWAARKQIIYQVDLPQNPLLVYFDADKLEKIVTNLLSNAFKFTPEEGRVHFTLRFFEESNPFVEIEVRDTGMGMRPEQARHIFDRFYSGAQESDALTGIGIGLALTKELVDLQGGNIEVISRPNQGAIFRVQLPAPLAAEENAPILATHPTIEVAGAARSETTPPRQQILTEHSNRPIILIAEDNPDLLMYMSDQLQKEYQILPATDGAAALQQAQESVPDLIITDVMMPIMNGTELCRQLRQDQRTDHIPIIMVTALSEQRDRLLGLDAGADAYLTKPFDAEELSLRASKLIEQQKRLREKYAAKFQAVQLKPIFSPSKEDQFLQQLVSVIEDQIDNEEFSIEDLSQAVGMSRSQLHRKVKAITDQSPSVFVRTIRLQHAYRLLEQKAGNISEIAFRVGIPNLAYFSRSFNQQFGVPPSKVLHEK